MGNKKKAVKDLFGQEVVFEPLSLFSLILSVSALCNAQARWLNENLDQFRASGGYAAATDISQAGQFLAAICMENMEMLQEIEITCPLGFGYQVVNRGSISDEKPPDLPF